MSLPWQQHQWLGQSALCMHSLIVPLCILLYNVANCSRVYCPTLRVLAFCCCCCCCMTSSWQRYYQWRRLERAWLLQCIPMVKNAQNWIISKIRIVYTRQKFKKVNHRYCSPVQAASNEPRLGLISSGIAEKFGVCRRPYTQKRENFTFSKIRQKSGRGARTLKF